MSVPTLTLQAAYDGIREYFSRDGAILAVREEFSEELSPSEDLSRCVYRRSDGHKCAVGCLVPDDKYEPLWDGGNGSGAAQVAMDVWGLSSRSLLVQFLERAQEQHDSSGSVDEFLLRLDDVADEFGLEVTL